jgi:putative ABC transport system permease protein
VNLKLLLMAIRAAWRALKRNKLRSALTMLGIVFGVGAVVAMVSVSQGADAMIQEQIGSLGTNLLMVFPGSTISSGVRSGHGGTPTLTVADAQAIQKECPSVAAVTPIRRQDMQVVAGNQNWKTVVQGVGTDYLRVRAWPLASGRFFTPREEKGAAKVCVIGQTVANNLFAPGQDPVGVTLRIENVPLRLIGLLAAKGQTGWGQDQDDTVIVPFTTAERKLMGSEILGTVNYIFVSAYSPTQVAQAEEEVRTLLRARHRIATGREDDFTVRSLLDIAAASAGASQVMTNLLASTASIALLVGGIGIMNILLVSVAERTREIGLRMAVGAKARHILWQFLVESTVLSLVGGVAGIGLGIGSARLVTYFAGWPVLLSPAAMVGAFLFSGAVGIFFGYYPAYKASHLDPIEALRYE